MLINIQEWQFPVNVGFRPKNRLIYLVEPLCYNNRQRSRSHAVPRPHAQNTEVNMKKTLPKRALALVLCLALLAGCTQRNPPKPPPASPDQASSSSQPPQEQAPAAPSVVTLVAVGDNLIHNVIYEEASARTGGQGYDFAPAYQYLAPLVADHDIAFYNQETPLASAVAPLASYPMFNSPTELGDFMQSLGFNVVTHANNHMLDQGERGLVATMDYWDATDALMVGPYRTQADMDKIGTITQNDITFAFVATTYGTNGLSLPADSAMRYILDTEEAEIQRQITRARQVADFVVVAPHWGLENTFEATEQQQALAQKMADWGADLIIGMHSHTIQPVQWLEGEGGNKTLVFYSMGNLISAMHGAYNMTSLLADLEITKDNGTGETTITKAEVTPLVTHFDFGVHNVTVYPLTGYTPDLAAVHGVQTFAPEFNYDYILTTVSQVIDPQFYSQSLQDIMAQNGQSVETRTPAAA